jgi:hypothetical protein
LIRSHGVKKLRTYDAETDDRLAVVDLSTTESNAERQSDFYIPSRSDDITTDERLNNFETRPMWIHAQPDGIRQRSAQKAGPNAQGAQSAAVTGQSSAQEAGAVGLVACADQGTYVLSAEPGWRGLDAEREQAIDLALRVGSVSFAARRNGLGSKSAPRLPRGRRISTLS